MAWPGRESGIGPKAGQLERSTVIGLDDALLDPPLTHCARDLLGSAQCVRRVLGRGGWPAEFIIVGVCFER
jgi:hypothetical protein